MSKTRGFTTFSLPKRGFTLVELLVTITIIAILSAVGLAMYSVAMKQGRDSKRQSDLRAIQSALEQYFADQFYYPVTISFGNPLSAGGKTYMNNLPTDPLESPQYSYTASPVGCDNGVTKCTSYCLYAKLENTSSSELGGCPELGSYNFAVTPP